MLKQKLKEDLKQSMLSKDTTRTSVIRLLISAIGYYEIQKGGAGYEATDEDILAVIQKEAKQHKDSIEQYQNAGRQELVDKEKSELKILNTYLPEQMTEEELRSLIKQTISQTNATSLQDMGKIMSAIIPKTKSKADGGLISKLVKEELTKN